MKVNYWHPFEEGQFYHVYNHAAGDKNIFISDKDYLDFLEKHFKYLSGVFDTLAYCLMPNHFHFIVKVKSYQEIVSFSKKVVSNQSEKLQEGESDINHFILDQYRKYFSSFALAYNYRNKHRGQLFLKRFKRVSIDPDVKLKYLICYLHHNPIHHGFVKNYHSWRYSSYLIIRNEEKVLKFSDKSTIEVSGMNYFNDVDEYDFIHKDFKIDYQEDVNFYKS